MTARLPSSLDRRVASARVSEAAGAIMAETFPRWAIVGGSVVTVGTVWSERITLVQGAYTTVKVAVVVQGVTLTNCYFGLYDASGNRLAVSADVSTALAAVAANGIYTGTLTYTVTAPADFYLALLVGSAVTNLQLQRGQAQIGLCALAPRIAGRSSTTGQTSLPNPVGAFNDSAATPSFWMRYE